MIKLSVIIAYYNAEQYIEELLDSLLDQGFSKDEMEIIVVDDESTHSVEILKNYCQSYPAVHYVWQKNALQSVARNNGIGRAKGEYLYFCDNDDKVNRGVLSRIWDLAHNNELDLLFFNRLMIGENELPPPKKMDFVLKEPICSGQQYIGNHHDMSTGPWHFIIRKQLVDRYGLKFPSGIIICEDVDFLAKASEVAERVSYVNVDVYYWIQRSKSISHYSGKKKMAEKYIGDMLWNMSERKKQIANSDKLIPQFKTWLEKSNHTHAFAILHNAFRYLPPNKNLIVIEKLVELGEYPLKGERLHSYKWHSIICFFMNRELLWLTLCRIYNIIPQSIRNNF